MASPNVFRVREPELAALVHIQVRRSMRVEHSRKLSFVAASRTSRSASSSRGFTLIELALVVTISLTVLGVALPSITTTVTNMYLGSSATSLASGLQSARYQAISTGCPVEVAVSAQTYQVLTQKLNTAVSPPQCGATYANVSCNAMFSASSNCSATSSITYAGPQISLSPSTTVTLTFNPSGTVTGPASMPTSLVLAPPSGTATKTITVSGVGNVSIQ